MYYGDLKMIVKYIAGLMLWKISIDSDVNIPNKEHTVRGSRVFVG